MAGSKSPSLRELALKHSTRSKKYGFLQGMDKKLLAELEEAILAIPTDSHLTATGIRLAMEAKGVVVPKTTFAEFVRLVLRNKGIPREST
jgi:hypothetical protein